MKTPAQLAVAIAVASIAALFALIDHIAPAQAVVADRPPPEAAPAVAGAPPAATPAVYVDDGFRLGEAGLTPAERAGREIWYKATAGNDRFHTYAFQQRVGVLIDWYRVLRGD